MSTDDKIAIGVCAYLAVGWTLATIGVLVDKKNKTRNFYECFYGLVMIAWPVMVVGILLVEWFDFLQWLSSAIANILVREEKR